MAELLDKLKAMIVHDGTPTNERSAALERLIKMITDGGGPVTRSVRIGTRRRRSVIDELGRIDPYAGDRTYGETIGSIHRACKTCSVLPISIDFGFHDSDEAVVAVSFASSGLPNGLDFQDALRLDWPKARVSATIQQGQADRTYLLYLGVEAPQREICEDAAPV